MRKIFILCCLCYSLTASAQIDPKGQSSVHYLLGHTHLVVSNSFINEDNGRDYTPYYMVKPDETFRHLIYGPELTISIFEADSTWGKKVHSGTFNIDTLPALRAHYRLSNLQARIIRDAGTPSAWSYCTGWPSAKDPGVYKKNDTAQHVTYYHYRFNEIPIGATLDIQFRKDDGTPLITLMFARGSISKKPFLMTSVADTNAITEMAFIQKQVQQKIKMLPEMSALYRYWSSTGLRETNTRYLPNTRLAYYFRNPTPNMSDSVFQYRLSGGKYRNNKWLPSDGFILVPSTERGAHYKLEVRYREHPQDVSMYTFYIPGAWYHNLWFEVVLVVLAVIITLLAISLYLIRNASQKAEKRRLEMKTLYAQLNPHFVFNALSSIQGLMNDHQLEKANRYLSGFATLLRNSMQTGNKESIPLQTELQNLHNYMQLEILRFNFGYEPFTDPQLDVSSLEVPPMLAQPLLENAVKHGVAALGAKGLITLQVTKDGQDILFSITDNGGGFDPSAQHDRQGIRLTKDRIALYNKLNRQQIILQIESGATGTKAMIRFKNWLSS